MVDAFTGSARSLRFIYSGQIGRFVLRGSNFFISFVRTQYENENENDDKVHQKMRQGYLLGDRAGETLDCADEYRKIRLVKRLCV